MKNYKEVIQERYDGYETETVESRYALHRRLGFYGNSRLSGLLYKIVNLLISSGININKVKILDVGCGSGSITRSLAEYTLNPKNIYGLDLSEHRIALAMKMNANIKYMNGDMVKGIPFNEKFDLITAFVVFMHLSNKEEIIAALQNIKEKLNPDGYFVWYDAYAKDHFKSKANADHNGFNALQMSQLANEAGFEKVLHFNLFKKLFNTKFHSYYLIERFPVWFVRLLEIIVPGKPGNVMIIYQKKK